MMQEKREQDRIRTLEQANARREKRIQVKMIENILYQYHGLIVKIPKCKIVH